MLAALLFSQEHEIMSGTILCLIDDQAHSGWAVDTAIGLSRNLGFGIVFFVANFEVMPMTTSSYATVTRAGYVVYCWSDEDIESFFAEARKRAWLRGVTDVRLLAKKVRDIVSSVIATVENEHADYLVLGCSFRPSLFRSASSALSWQISLAAPCPTIIVRKPPKLRDAGLEREQGVVIPSASSEGR